MPNNEMVIGSENLTKQVQKVRTKGKFGKSSDM